MKSRRVCANLVAVAAVVSCSWAFAQDATTPARGDDGPRRQPAEAVRRAQPEVDTTGLRRPGPRGFETIFSPLNLPTPNERRLASGAPGPEYWQQRVDYAIDATLDDVERTIKAKARITYTNNSPHPLTYIWLNLEQNLFHPSSRGARLTTRGARFGNRDGFEGGFNIEYVRLANPQEVTARAGGRAMMASGADLPLHVHDTLGRIDLPAPIAPGGGVFVFDIAWSFNIPPYGSDRMGIEDVEQGAVFQVAQWFPNVAVYDDVHGWNTMPYLGAGEFYTNFGDYDVKITVPRSHIVAAAGELQNPDVVLTSEQRRRIERARESVQTVMIRSAAEVGDPASRPAGTGPLTWRFVARDVRTFAWASSASFIWDAAGLGATLVQSMYPKEALPLWEQSTEMLRDAIDGYNKRWYVYPYPVAINVSGIVGGMEYPMILFCRGRSSERGLWGVTTHEIGHNWFPMVVNTDERRHAWMDEGFTTFINYYSTRDRHPETTGGRGDGRGFAATLRRGIPQPMATFPDQYGRGLLGTMAYSKPATALVLLREVVLEPARFDRAFREYIHRWAFKSPQPADFFRTMEDVAGEDLAWFWRGWFIESTSLDQAVDGVEHSEGGEWAVVAFRNVGDMVMPVPYRVTYSDGATEDHVLPVEAWFSADVFAARVLTRGRKIVEVLIDPEARLPDVNLRNNRWRADGAGAVEEDSQGGD